MFYLVYTYDNYLLRQYKSTSVPLCRKWPWSSYLCDHIIGLWETILIFMKIKFTFNTCSLCSLLVQYSSPILSSIHSFQLEWIVYCMLNHCSMYSNRLIFSTTAYMIDMQMTLITWLLRDVAFLNSQWFFSLCTNFYSSVYEGQH